MLECADNTMRLHENRPGTHATYVEAYRTSAGLHFTWHFQPVNDRVKRVVLHMRICSCLFVHRHGSTRVACSDNIMSNCLAMASKPGILPFENDHRNTYAEQELTSPSGNLGGLFCFDFNAHPRCPPQPSHWRNAATAWQGKHTVHTMARMQNSR